MASEAQNREQIAKLILDCRKAAKEKRFYAALESVTTALRLSACDMSTSCETRLTLLDIRVAVYLRMLKTDRALRDAKAMIRVDRKDGRGYIRCGQIERLQDNKARAIEYYEHGLKSIPTSDPYFYSITEKLHDLREQIKSELFFSRRTDPMTTLPLEVVESILSFLDYRQHVQMLRVSKPWKNMLLGRPPLTNTIAFPQASKDITPRMLRATLRRVRAPKTVIAHNLTKISAEILNTTLQRWEDFTSLQHLEIDNQWLSGWKLPLSKYNLKILVLGPDPTISSEDVSIILRDCPSLEIARFQKVLDFHHPGSNPERGRWILASKTLKQLYMNVKPFSDRLDAGILLSGLPRLKSLYCSGILWSDFDTSIRRLDLRHMKQLETLIISGSILPNIHLPQTIRKLSFHSVGWHDDELSEPFAVLENLQTLVVDECGSFPVFVLPSITTGAEHVTLENCTIRGSQQTGPQLERLFQSGFLKDVKVLRLKQHHIVDSWSQYFIDGCPMLENLHLEQAQITGVFVSDMLKKAKPSKVRKITLEACPKVSKDLVAWADARHVEVNLIPALEGLRAHRVRSID
ncbi:uncharacterized protein Z518_05412 [Rhinocladiella mackenziei CBS 650.93]|uniref:F-box domain-containing protein n=1 Tax=Rhinocladiella mackenziei CBS 650.93 TaxID=1442369 RepID=A0A0D2FQV2_9EURO|nr:uncharacterized protein Z518_05412 [Rhinocladiella mackenziei CBS 650.93]KIX04542.1 hypothetical protein Z518_05412 [Rhinocladiella mackenziei CBS 650.93]